MRALVDWHRRMATIADMGPATETSQQLASSTRAVASGHVHPGQTRAEALEGLRQDELEWRGEMACRFGSGTYESAAQRAAHLGLTFRGEHNPCVSYNKGQAVFWFGGLFRCRRDYRWRTEFYGPDNCELDIDKATPINVAKRTDLWELVA